MHAELHCNLQWVRFTISSFQRVLLYILPFATHTLRGWLGHLVSSMSYKNLSLLWYTTHQWVAL